MLKAIIIESIKDCPDIHLDKENNRFEFSGRSLLLNPSQFAEPIINWISDYIHDPNPSTVIKLNFEYINSASIRMMIDILLRFKSANLPGFKITWTIEDDDEIMKERGDEIANVLKVPFDFIFVEEK